MRDDRAKCQLNSAVTHTYTAAVASRTTGDSGGNFDDKKEVMVDGYTLQIVC
jgi:hypothetical protein